MPEPKFSSTLRRREYITDEKRLLEIIFVNADYLSAKDSGSGEFVTVDRSELDVPDRWRKVVPDPSKVAQAQST